MSTLSAYIQEISEKYVQEAQSAPQLFQDMGAMEKYMAESYSSRVMIELLQNADDAGSADVRMIQVGRDIIFANNGTVFSNADILAISRSGKSSKSRGTSIGYRGVGFKSATYLSDVIVIESNEATFSFSRRITEKRLQMQHVPIVRIPFLVDKSTLQLETSSSIEKMKLEGFTTFFIFQNARTDVLVHELMELSNDYFVFLQNIHSAHFCIEGISKTFSLNKILSTSQMRKVSFQSGERIKWEIFSKPEDHLSVAFRIDDENRLIACAPEQALFHCFLPTLDKNALPFKINADFSTDPSRKHITEDEHFEMLVPKISGFLFELLSGDLLTISQRMDLTNLLEQNVGFSLRTNKIMEYLRKEVTDKLTVENMRGDLIPISQTLAQPSWLDNTEYQTISRNSKQLSLVVPKSEQFSLPFFSKLGEVEFNRNVLENLVSDREVALYTNPESYGKLVGKYVSCSHQENAINGTNPNLEHVLIKVAHDVIPLSEARTKSEFQTRTIIDNISPSDVRWLASQNVIEPPAEFSTVLIQRDDVKNRGGLFPQARLNQRSSNQTSSVFELGRQSIHANIHAWKAAEDNCVEFERTLGNIARNISKQNLGYDVESRTPNGEFRYIDVKKLSAEGAPFSLTNNEYSSAMQLGDQYFLCLIFETSDKIRFSYISNPLKNANFVKQVKQWCWYADEYLAQNYDYVFPN